MSDTIDITDLNVNNSLHIQVSSRNNGNMLEDDRSDSVKVEANRVDTTSVDNGACGTSNAANSTIFTPLRFSYVTPQVSRGAYPTLPCFRYLHRLRLRCIVSVTPEAPSQDVVDLCELLGIKLVHIQALHTASIQNLTPKVFKAVNVLIQPEHLPAYVHCLDGRRVASLVVLMLRRVQGWPGKSAMEEFWRFQMPIMRDVTASDVDRIEADIEKLYSTPLSNPTYANSSNTTTNTSSSTPSVSGGGCNVDDLPENTIRLPADIPSWIWGGDRGKAAAVLYRGRGDKSSAALTSSSYNQQQQQQMLPPPQVPPPLPLPPPIAAPGVLISSAVSELQSLQDLITPTSSLRPPLPATTSTTTTSSSSSMTSSMYAQDSARAQMQQQLFLPLHASNLSSAASPSTNSLTAVGSAISASSGSSGPTSIVSSSNGRLRRSSSGAILDRASPASGIFDPGSARRYEGVGEIVTYGSGDSSSNNIAITNSASIDNSNPLLAIRSTRSMSPTLTPRSNQDL